MPRKVLRQGRHCTGFALILLVSLTSLSGCGLSYYTQAASGEIGIISQEHSIKTLVAANGTPANIKRRLLYILKVRRFAQHRLNLPLQGNYADYADIHRPYVVWNVFAARPLHLALKRWCFPIAGCVAYRGYFSKKSADRYAQHLKKQGYDVFVGGVPAYATLGYLHDPVLNTFLGDSRPAIAYLIFHELSHDLVYIQNATTFNESFADTVAAVGVQRFLKNKGTPKERQNYLQQRREQAQILAAMNACRERLKGIYHDLSLSRAARLQEKQASYARLKQDFAALTIRWHGDEGFAGFFHNQFNNALLGAYVSYEKLVPAFRRLLTLENGNLPAFFRAVRWYGRLPANRRDRELRSRADLVSRLSAFHKAQNRSNTPHARRPKIVCTQRPGLAGAIQYRPHNQT